MKFKLDSIDEKIIELLQENARISIKDKIGRAHV